MGANQQMMLAQKITSGGGGGGLVQTSGKKQATGVGASTSFTMPANFTSGNTAILTFTTNAVPSDITIGGVSITYDSIEFPYGGVIGGIGSAVMTGGSDQIVVTYGSGTTNAITFSCEEWSDIAATPVDQVPASVTGANPTITSGALAQASERVYIAFSTQFSGSVTSPAGYTETWNEMTTAPLGAGGYKDVSSTTAVSAQYTGATGCALMVTYKKV